MWSQQDFANPKFSLHYLLLKCLSYWFSAALKRVCTVSAAGLSRRGHISADEKAIAAPRYESPTCSRHRASAKQTSCLWTVASSSLPLFSVGRPCRILVAAGVGSLCEAGKRARAFRPPPLFKPPAGTPPQPFPRMPGPGPWGSWGPWGSCGISRDSRPFEAAAH